MKEQLYKAIKDHCEENHCWGIRYSAKEWNEIFHTAYSPATFTALVSDGRLVRSLGWHRKSHDYGLAPTPEMIAKEEEEKRKTAIHYAQWRVENYEQQKAEQKAYYDERIAEITKNYEERLAFLEDEYIKAKELLASV
jgi:hypothetical protein